MQSMYLNHLFATTNTLLLTETLKLCYQFLRRAHLHHGGTHSVMCVFLWLLLSTVHTLHTIQCMSHLSLHAFLLRSSLFYICSFPGYEQFSQWRSDTTLCFNGIVGKQPKRRRKSKKSFAKSSSKDDAGKEELGEEDEVEEEFALDEEEEESDGEIGSYSTPPPLSKFAE